MLTSQQNANLSKIPSTHERENHQIIPLCISLMVPLAQDLRPTTCQDCYQVMYYNVLDNIVTSVKDQFNQSSFVVYENIESLLPKIIKCEDTSDESESIK